MLGLQSYWDASYAEDLANYQEHGQAGEIWLVGNFRNLYFLPMITI